MSKPPIGTRGDRQSERSFTMLEYADGSQIIDELCEKLQDIELEDYDVEEELLLDIGDIVTEYINSRLGDFASVWVEGRDRGKIKPVWAYGTDFWPDIAIEVRELPTVAIEVKLAKRDSSLAGPLREAIGQALIYSVQYPYVVAFVLDQTEGDLRKHWFDSEIEALLWDNHRISLIIRQ